MKATQLTIRNLPEPIDRYLRKRAEQTGKSINQTVIDELSEAAGITKNGAEQSLLESLSWFIGSGMDQDVVDALEEEDRSQKQSAARELAKFQQTEQ